MGRRKKASDKAGESVVDYRHKAVKRLNIPPAGLTARGEIIREKKVRYAYNPHLSPVLRFDATGKADSIEKLIEDASLRKLEPHEIKLLQETLRNHEPWLEWAGKREQQWCVADPVALHIHERISTQAILRVAKRQDVQRNLFADRDWPKELKNALTEYRQAWRQKMDEVNACISARADQEELIDQPFADRSKVRVSGPFTVEGVIPAEESIDDEEPRESLIGGAPEELETFDGSTAVSPLDIRSESQNAEAYLDRMIRLLRGDGVRFPDNKVVKFSSLEALADGSILHAKGTWGNGEESDRWR